MSKYILKRKNVVGYLDFHAYSQLWMWPFGGDCDEIPKDAEDITECAMGAAKALYGVHGKKFSVGRVCDVVYQASGGSIDWYGCSLVFHLIFYNLMTNVTNGSSTLFFDNIGHTQWVRSNTRMEWSCVTLVSMASSYPRQKSCLHPKRPWQASCITPTLFESARSNGARAWCAQLQSQSLSDP